MMEAMEEQMEITEESMVIDPQLMDVDSAWDDPASDNSASNDAASYDPLSEYLSVFEYFPSGTVQNVEKNRRDRKDCPRCIKEDKEKEERKRLMCNHDDLKSEDMQSCYELLHAFYVACITENAFKRKVSDCICNVKSCKKNGGKKRIHACLSCIYFACYEKRHIHQHGKENRHFFAMDTESGNIFCSYCDDYIYPADYAEIATKQNLIASQRQGTTNMLLKWQPTPDEADVLNAAFKANELVYDNENDVKGIVNIGRFTCYFNVLVQCLTHAPIFRDYLLSVEHKCINKDACVICQLSNVVQVSISDKNESFHVSELFCAFFTQQKRFATSSQEDSHDCLIHIIDCLLKDAAIATENAFLWNQIIKDTFVFQHEKKRICKVNGCVTPLADNEEKTVILYSSLLDPSDDKPIENMLEREWTTDLSDSKCDTCGSVGVVIQTIPKRLPDVMNFLIAPPAVLSSSAMNIDLKSFVVKTPGENADSLEYKYSLFGVVHRLGATSSMGHYKCDIRKNKDTWFECDDTSIEKITEDSVLKEEVFLLFYHKVHMGLKAIDQESEVVYEVLYESSEQESEEEHVGLEAREQESEEEHVGLEESEQESEEESKNQKE